MKLISCKNIKNNAYEIDENGNIWSNLTQKFLRAGKDKDGYLKISLRTMIIKLPYFVSLRWCCIHTEALLQITS